MASNGEGKHLPWKYIMSNIFAQAPEVTSITILDLSQGVYIVILQYAGGKARSSRHFFSSYEGACAFTISYDLPIRNLTHKDCALGTYRGRLPYPLSVLSCLSSLLGDHSGTVAQGGYCARWCRSEQEDHLWMC